MSDQIERNIRETKNGIVISVKVIPNASKNEVAGWEHGRLKIKTTTTPEKGKANAAVEALLAKHLGVPKSAVNVIRGTTSREKEIEIASITLQQFLVMTNHN